VIRGWFVLLLFLLLQYHNWPKVPKYNDPKLWNELPSQFYQYVHQSPQNTFTYANSFIKQLLIRYFRYAAQLNWILCFVVFYVVYFLNCCILVFTVWFLCFVFRCSIGNIVAIISYHGRPARWSTPSHLICTLIVFIANELCCCCL